MIARQGAGPLATAAPGPPTFTENVAFTSSTGSLELAHGKGYTGTITGLSSAGTNSLLLDDVTFDIGKTAAKYVANGGNTGGVLTIFDAGVAEATVHLTGTYTTAGFVLSRDARAGPRWSIHRRCQPLR